MTDLQQERIDELAARVIEISRPSYDRFLMSLRIGRATVDETIRDMELYLGDRR